MTSMTILLAVDGSEHAGRAATWCARHAVALSAEVVVVYAVDIPYVFGFGSPLAIAPPPPPYTKAQLDELHDLIARDWCKPLADAGVPFRFTMVDGRPATALVHVAQQESAEMIVTGRRGHRSLAEKLLGSTSHELSHQADRPLVIVP